MGNITYTCQALMGTNKAGTLKPDADGYYEMVLGALDFYNSAGAFYDLDNAKDRFKASSSLMRRIANGALRGEYGHPKKLPGQTERDFMKRICDIYEDRVSHHIREVRIDYTSVKTEDGKPCIAIIGLVKPCGPYGAALQASIDNPKENVCFSIRSLTDDVIEGGKWFKHLKVIITWDLVNEPGLSIATKWKAPSLESFAETRFSATIVNDIHEDRKLAVGMESSAITADDLKEAFKPTTSKMAPASLGW